MIYQTHLREYLFFSKNIYSLKIKLKKIYKPIKFQMVLVWS